MGAAIGEARAVTDITDVSESTMKKAELLPFFVFSFVFLSLPRRLDVHLLHDRLLRLHEGGLCIDLGCAPTGLQRLRVLLRHLRHRDEAVGRGERLSPQVEDTLRTVVAELARACLGPLHLIGVDVDALLLRVAPAAGQLLEEVRLLLRARAAVLAGGNGPLAACALVLSEERLILAGLRHAELHLAAAAPLVLLACNRLLLHALHHLLLGCRLLHLALGLLLWRLALEHLQLQVVHLVTPQGVDVGLARTTCDPIAIDLLAL